MIGILVVTHGRLATELVDSARRIVGSLEGVEAITLGWHDEVEAARERLADSITRLGADGHGVLVLTDMFGGTPTNLALTFLDRDRVEVVTGVNLAMLLRLSSRTDQDSLRTLCLEVCEQGRKSIRVASEMLARVEG